MKKLIAVLTLLLAFTVSANAQETKVSAAESAKIEATQLAQAVGLTETQTQDFVRLFMMKYEKMNNPSLSEEKKKEFSRVVDAKIKASMNADQLKVLEANPELMARLTGASTVATPKK